MSNQNDKNDQLFVRFCVFFFSPFVKKEDNNSFSPYIVVSVDVLNAYRHVTSNANLKL